MDWLSLIGFSNTYIKNIFFNLCIAFNSLEGYC